MTNKPTNAKPATKNEDPNEALEKALSGKRETTPLPSDDEFERDIARGVSKTDDIYQPVADDIKARATTQRDGNYEDLRLILELAYHQAATGKGKQRHAVGPVGTRPWSKQPILEIGRMVGPGYASGQVAKKVQEAVTMAGNGNFKGAEAEALGAIVYAAALFKLLTEMDLERNN